MIRIPMQLDFNIIQNYEKDENTSNNVSTTDDNYYREKITTLRKDPLYNINRFKF
jgi:hypothetical protein